MGAAVRLAALAALALVSACATDGAGTTPAPDRTTFTTAGSTPTATPTRRPAAGPPTAIGDDIGLPHQWTWRDSDDASRQPLFDFCLETGARLRPPATTDFRGRIETKRRASRSESLGIYADRHRAARAIRAWRRQAATCANGDSLGHTGEHYEWSIVEVTVPGADEAWLGREIGSNLRLRDGRIMVSTTVVARVGTAVYSKDTRRAVRRGATAMSARTAAEIASLAAYVPTLRVFRS
ncbi:hypothetical protein [Nocardioides zhouii]|uniref:Sensor domain-containing protein n=1 Tax=Nocardioides zhouii TaxID=1168729 RepID=A0A4Q2T891_9ACTN|nr:hypothetical protein [Nocardioides zhouii]RYC12999.1 hypothetical protein EUA94_07175 [Nocardioides zhouii]